MSGCRSASKWEIDTAAGKPVTLIRPLASVAATMLSIPVVPLMATAVDRAVADSAAERRREIDLDLGDVRAEEVAHHDVVGSSERIEVNRLDVMQIHCGIGDIAEEPRMFTIRGNIDLLGDVRAVEVERVGAVLAIDRVAAVARVPDEGVIAGAEECEVVTLVAVDDIIAIATDEDVRTSAAVDRVVAGAAVDREDRDAGSQSRGRDGVVAAEAIDDQLIVGAFGARDGHERRQSDHREARPAPRMSIDVVAVRAVDGHGVGLQRHRSSRRACWRDRSSTVLTSVPVRSFTVIVSAPPSAARSMVSTSSRSIVTLATFAERTARPPFAEISKFSVTFAPLNSERVGAGLALDGVAAVARIPVEGVVARAEEGDVVALVAVDEVVAVAAEEQVGAVAAEDRIVAGAAVDGELDQGGKIAGGGKAVVAAVGVEDEVLGRADVDAERRGIDAVEAHPGAIGRDGERPRRRCRR